MSDWLEKALMAALALVTGGGGVAWYTTIRGERRADRQDKRAETGAEVEVTGKRVDIVSQLLGDVQKLQSRQGELFSEVDAARTDASHARQQADAAKTEAAQTRSDMHRLRTTLVYLARHMAPIIAWIDGGAPAPAPVIPEDLRRLVDELGQSVADGHQNPES